MDYKQQIDDALEGADLIFINALEKAFEWSRDHDDGGPDALHHALNRVSTIAIHTIARCYTLVHTIWGEKPAEIYFEGVRQHLSKQGAAEKAHLIAHVREHHPDDLDAIAKLMGDRG